MKLSWHDTPSAIRVGQFVHKRRCFSQMPACAQESGAVGRKPFFQQRENLMTQEIPIERDIFVTLVGNPMQSPRPCVFFNLAARYFQ